MLAWDGSVLSLRRNNVERVGLTAAGVLTIKDSSGAAVITLDASAGAEITKKLTMPGANSAIAIGATPPTANNSGTGIWIDRTGMYGLAANVVQAKFDATTGAIMAGAGNVRLDASGLSVKSGSSALPINSYMFHWPDGSSFGSLAAWLSVSPAGRKTMSLQLHSTNGGEAVNRYQLEIESKSPQVTGNLAYARLMATMGVPAAWVLAAADRTSGSTVTYVEMVANAVNIPLGGLNLGTATGAGAGEVLGKGAANYLRWVLENTQSNPNLADIGVLDSAGQGIYMGRRGPNDTAYAGYGAAGDAYIYTGASGRGFNIIVPDSVDGILRLYVGTSPTGGAPKVTVLKTGNVLIGTTSDDGVNLLQVSGSVKAVYTATSWLDILDGVAAPATVAGWARIYVDSADGDLKIKFGDGTVKTIVTD